MDQKKKPPVSCVRKLSVTLATVSSLLFSGCAFAAQAVAVMGKGADITPMCGSKPAIVALTDGYGGDTWRKITQAEFRAEAAKCPNIKKVIYANANGDQQKSNSDINSLVAQGVNVLVSFTDFGDAMLPAFKNATKAGVTVVPYFSQIVGTPGRDYAQVVYQDPDRVGGMWADWLGTTLKTGNVVMLGGTAGATSSQRFMDGFKAGLKKYPGIKLLDDKFIVTNWNPVDGQKAVAGLIAKYPKIDGIASDYGVTTLAAVKAFEQANLPVPAQTTGGSNNELNCKYLDAKKTGAAWKYMALDGTTTLARFALRRAMASYEGTPNSEPNAIVPYVYADSTKGMDPRCDPTVPPDADLSSTLPDSELKKLFAR
jgi:ribose transport system substrate-binding protein